MTKIKQSGWVDQEPFKKIATTTKKNTPILNKMITNIKLSWNFQNTHLMTMKIMAILVILCQTIHKNNSNYLLFLIILYLYCAGAWVNAIILLNWLGLTIFYNVLQKRLKDIAANSACMIKKKAINPQIVGIWDNFEYRKNMHKKCISNKVKF